MTAGTRMCGVGVNGSDDDMDKDYCQEVEVRLRPIIPTEGTKEARFIHVEVTYITRRVRWSKNKDDHTTIKISPFPRWMPQFSKMTTKATKNNSKTSLTNLSISVSYDSTSSSSSSSTKRNKKIPSMPVGTRIHATFSDDGTDSSDDIGEKEMYSNVIRSLSSKDLILSCASMDGSIWRPRMHTITNVRNDNNHHHSSYTTALPQYQPSQCHNSILQRIMTTTTTHAVTGNTRLPCHPLLHLSNARNKHVSLWFNYDKDNDNEQQLLQETWTEGFQYTTAFAFDSYDLFTTGIRWGSFFQDPSSFTDLHCSSLQLFDSMKIFVTMPKDKSFIQMSNQNSLNLIDNDDDDDNSNTYVFDFIDIDLGFEGPLLELTPHEEEAKSIAMTSTSATTNESKIGIQRTILRSHGVSNSGTFQTRIYYQSANNRTETERVIPFTLVDFFPRVVQPIWHSMKIEFLQQPGAGDEHFIYQNDKNNIKMLDPITDTTHRHLSHTDGHSTLELSISTLQPDSSLYVSVDYDFSLLSYDDYPPDPNQGIHIPSSYITTSSVIEATNNNDMYKYPTFLDADTKLFSNALIVLPPVPDMSMPFNVCAITSTLQSFVFVSILTFSVRKASQRITDKLEKKTEQPLSWKQKIKQKINKKIPFLFPNHGDKSNE